MLALYCAVTGNLVQSPFSARSKSHSRSPASPCCLLLVAALRTRLEPLFPALRGRKSTPPAAAAPGEQPQHTQWRTSSCRTAACTGARHTYAERARAWPRARVASCSTMPRSRHGNRTRLGALGGQNKAMSRGAAQRFGREAALRSLRDGRCVLQSSHPQLQHSPIVSWLLEYARTGFGRGQGPARAKCLPCRAQSARARQRQTMGKEGEEGEEDVGRRDNRKKR